jgi:hypothetical protein
LDATTSKNNFLQQVADASGKPVIVQSDPKFAGHATIKIASEDQPAHLLLYKHEHEAVLPYLVAYECSFALRSIMATPGSQFDLVSTPNMPGDVLALMQKHHQGKDVIPGHAVLEYATRFGNGLGLQLRSMPITMRIDKQIYDDHPELREMQQSSIDQQLQENMQALSPRAKEIAPNEIIKPNASMSAAFAKFFSELWDAPIVFAPYAAAGYTNVATDLLAIQRQIPGSPDNDRALVDAWAKHLDLDRWFKTRGR